MLFIYLIKWLYVNIIFVFVSITSCALHHGMHSLFTDEPNSFYLSFCKISMCFLLKIKVYNVAIHLRAGWCVA